MATTDTASKWQHPGDNNPPKQVQKKTKSKTKISIEGTKWCICEGVIALPSKNVEGDDALFCEGFCPAWCHRKCIGFSKQLFKVVCESDDPFLCLYCSLTCYQKEIAEQFKSLTSEVALLKNWEPMLITNEVENLHTNVSSVEQSSTVPLIHHSISKIITMVLSEEKEKEKCCLNLIIHNFKELQESDPQKRKEDDIYKSTKLFQNYLGTQVSISNASRIGKKYDNTDKPCLLKVTVSSSWEKAQVLQNCTKLCNKDNPEEIQSVYVTPDVILKSSKK